MNIKLMIATDTMMQLTGESWLHQRDQIICSLKQVSEVIGFSVAGPSVHLSAGCNLRAGRAQDCQAITQSV